jgi:hypothetical protein
LLELIDGQSWHGFVNRDGMLGGLKIQLSKIFMVFVYSLKNIVFSSAEFSAK